MERIPTYVFVLGFLFFCSFGDVFADPLTDKVPIDSIKLLLKSVGGSLGIKALGASGTLIQILVRVLQSSVADGFFQKQKPWVRFALISALTFSVTPIGLMTLSGLPLAAALLHTTTLNAFMVFLDQMIKAAPKKKVKENAPRKPSIRISRDEDDRDRRRLVG